MHSSLLGALASGSLMRLQLRCEGWGLIAKLCYGEIYFQAHATVSRAQIPAGGWNEGLSSLIVIDSLLHKPPQYDCFIKARN